MTATTYELRTVKGARCLAFDSEQRARDEQRHAEQRIKTRLELWRVRTVEDRLT